MLSIVRLPQTNHAAGLAIETPSGMRQDFFRRRKDRQRPSRELSRAADSTESPCPRFLPRACFLADLRPQSSANTEPRPTIYESKNFTENTTRHRQRAHNYFKNRFMPSRSIMASQLYSVSIPSIPNILPLPCRGAKFGNAATPNFPGGTLKSPTLRSLICAALTFRLVPPGKRADRFVGFDAIPSDLKTASVKVVTNAPVSTSRRAGWP